MRDQVHAWKAQIDPDALVFTTHPVTDVDQSSSGGTTASPGTGPARPRCPGRAQHERTAIHIYQPAWDESTDALLWVGVRLPALHPRLLARRTASTRSCQEGDWTFAGKGGGRIALWSWRAPTWRAYDPAVEPPTA